MNHDRFLQIGGSILFLLGIVGLFGIIGPDAASSVFSTNWFFDAEENYVLIIAGFAAMLSSGLLSHGGQKNLSRSIGAVSLIIAAWSLFANNVFGIGLETPADTIFYGVIGLWGIIASTKGKHSVT